MRVLVSVASKHGSTDDIGRAIAGPLMEAGIEAVLLPPEDVERVADFDAVVLGSAVYAGHWLEPVKRLIEAQGDKLRARPVWLFSSGPSAIPRSPSRSRSTSPGFASRAARASIGSSRAGSRSGSWASRRRRS